MSESEQAVTRTIPGIAPGERYVVRVRAISRFGVASDWSEAYDLQVDGEGGVVDWIEQELTLYDWSHTNSDTHEIYALADGTRGAFAKQGDIDSAINALPKVYTHNQSTQSVDVETEITTTHTFPTGTFSSTPSVTVSAIYDDESSDIGCYISSISSSSVSVVLYNRSESSKSIGFSLIAIQA